MKMQKIFLFLGIFVSIICVSPRAGARAELNKNSEGRNFPVVLQAPGKNISFQPAPPADNFRPSPLTVACRLLEDASRENETFLLDLAVDITGLVSEKYPDLPLKMTLWRMEMIRENRLENNDILLLEELEVRTVIEGNFENEFKNMAEDIEGIITEKYDNLGLAVKKDIDEFTRNCYPELQKELISIRTSENVNPRIESVRLICRSYPVFYHNLFKMLREKHGEEIQQALLDILITLDQKYPEVLSRFQRQMSGSIQKESPGLLAGIHRQKQRDMMNIQQKIAISYPSLNKDLAELLSKKHEDFLEAIENNLPETPPSSQGQLAVKMLGLFDKIGRISKLIIRKH